VTSSAKASKRPWLKAYPEHVDWATPISEEPVTQVFDRVVARHGDRLCIDFLDKTYSYRRVGELVKRAAKGFVICYYAVLKAGGTVVNFNPLYVAEEIERQIADSETQIMVTLDLRAMLPKVSAALDTTGLKQVVVCPMADILPFPKNYLFAFVRRGEVARAPRDGRHLRFAELIDNDAEPAPVALRPREDIAVLQYTGGTTGVPKGAMLTHANVAANAHQVQLWNPEAAEGEERVLGVLPLFHVLAMTAVMNHAIRMGGALILRPRFELDDTLRMIDEKHPGYFAGVPTIYNAINHHPRLARYDLSSLKLCISGGAALPVEVKRDFERLTGCCLIEGYGLSECSPAATCTPIAGAVKEGSIGLPLPGTIIEVHDLKQPGRTLPPGEKGEICIRGPQVMAGYWNRPEATAQTIVGDALHTGDVGYMDEDGYVFLVDRIKDLIICSGYNVYPRVLEEAIYRHDAVAEVTVIGVPDDYRGEAPKAFVRLKADRTLTAAELLSFLEDKLSKIEMPEYIELRNELPKTQIGKLSKKELVAEELARRKVAAGAGGRAEG
jgi:long-chain acyl-CoA synthetase